MPYLTDNPDTAFVVRERVRNGELMQLKALIKEGVDFKTCFLAPAPTVRGYTPLHIAAWGTAKPNYDRDIVLISTRRLDGVQLINQGEQVVCLPGATLDRLERELAPLGREPHSVIGSSCIGASVLGGVCNNSGGALVNLKGELVGINSAILSVGDADDDEAICECYLTPI